MSLTATVLLIYAACLASAVMSLASAVMSVPRLVQGQSSSSSGGSVLIAFFVLVLALLTFGGHARAAPGSEAASRAVAGPAAVVDGVTLTVGGERLALYGIDAPQLDQTCFDRRERRYACGRAAATALDAKIGGQTVSCDLRGTTEERRSAVCRLGDDDLAAWMVSSGYAVADRSISSDYALQVERAWGRRLGLWLGVFQVPAQWRRRQDAWTGL